MKKCKICETTKSINQFAKNATCKDGVGTYCIECNRKRGKKRYQEKREFLIKQQQDYRKNNYDVRIEVERKARKKNKEKYRPTRNERQLRRARVIKEKTFLLLKKEIIKLYSDPCFNCKSTKNQSIDHIIPISRGGSHSIGNLITLCRSCNSSKNNKFMIEWKNHNRLILKGSG